MYTKKIIIALFGLTVFIIVGESCGPKPTVGSGKSSYSLDKFGVDYIGTRTNDPSLQAVIIPCQDNNTFRMYYSDSAKNFGLPDSLTVVSYGKRTHLGYKECCIEATSSSTDTWLSTGSDHTKFKAGNGYISVYNVVVQHFTSTPQNDSTKVEFILEAL